MIKRKLPLEEKFSGPLRVRLRQVLLYYNYFFLLTLQDTIDTVTVEGVENVQEEVHIEIKTEEKIKGLCRQ